MFLDFNLYFELLIVLMLFKLVNVLPNYKDLIIEHFSLLKLFMDEPV